MPFYQFTKTQKLPSTIDEIWDFISTPENLKEITPDYLGFEDTSNNHGRKMYPGMIITHKVSPLFGIKMNWMTEITHVKEKEYFVDEQRVGPYKLWHHQHMIEPIQSGVLMTDTITYIPPFGFLGAIVNSLVIKKKLNEIFEYRVLALEKRFGKM